MPRLSLRSMLVSNISKVVIALMILIFSFLISLVFEYQYGQKLALSSARLKNSVVPRTILSLSILDEIDDMNANTLEYTLGEVEEKDEFYRNYQALIIFLNTLKSIVPEKKFFIEQVTELVEEYEKRARTQIFDQLDLKLKGWADDEVGKLIREHGEPLDDFINEIKDSLIAYETTDPVEPLDRNRMFVIRYYLELIDEISDQNANLKDYVSGNATAKDDFKLNSQAFDNYLEELSNIAVDEEVVKNIKEIKQRYSLFYDNALEIFHKYDPKVEIKVATAIDSLEHDIVLNLEQILLMEAKSAESDARRELNALDIMARNNKDLLWILLGVVLLVSIAVLHFISNNIFKPMADLSADLQMLAKDNTNIDILYQDRSDEMGILANSIHVLKESVIARKKAEASLIEAKHKAEEATEYKSNFLANMSHEIRTPMNAINGMVDLALKKTQNKHVKDYLSKIKVSSATLLNIINDILDFSKIEAGKLKIDKIEFDLDKVLSHLSTYLSEKNRVKGLEVLYKVDSGVPRGLVGDPLRLEQILLNLASNSMKFTDHGEIVISISLVRQVGDQVNVKFSVSDTGIGIPESFIEKLIRPFTQADESITRQYGGTGLGLSISKNLVELMGGELSIKSNPGQGTEIFFILPLKYYDIDSNYKVIDYKLHESEFILLDNNRRSLNVLHDMLIGLGFKTVKQVKHDQTLESVFELDGEERIKIIFIDWNWGHRPSTDVLNYVREKLQDQSIRMVFTTSNASPEVLDMIESKKPDAVLVKPFSSSVLYNTLVSIIGRKAILMNQKPEMIDETFIENKKKLKGINLLVAEDNDVNQEVIRELLTDEGINVTVKENGLKILQELKLNPNKYAAVLMDIQMPIMDGFSATKEIRKSNTSYRDIPIIALTAHALVTHREQTIEAGMNAHVVKPIDVANLFEELVRYIDFSQLGMVKGEEKKVLGEYDYKNLDSLILPGLNVAKSIKRYHYKKHAYLVGIRSFDSTVPKKWEQLKECIINNDCDQGFEIAHSLKGACSIIDTDDLIHKFERLEQLLRDEHKADYALVADIDECLGVAFKSIKDLLEHYSE